MESSYTAIGKDCHLVDGALDDFNVAVLSMPRAKLKHIIREGHSLAKTSVQVTLLSYDVGTHDTKSDELGQLTIHQAMTDLLSWNILVTNIPKRYDQPFLNRDIIFLSDKISILHGDNTGNFKISKGDVTESLHRSYYTRHGLHFNKAGSVSSARRWLVSSNA
ncbi:hypothetical protein J6590_041820 [Homalodisca vitripennis]|nr:hypothetical protein J6590_041820 [Homalodisca vitripennis]